MKTMKKIVATALCFVILFTVAAPLFAAAEDGSEPAAKLPSAIEVQADKERCKNNETINFTITVTNDTPDELTNVPVKFESYLKNGFKIRGFNFGNEKDTPIAVIPSIAPGETKTVTVSCKVRISFFAMLLYLIKEHIIGILPFGPTVPVPAPYSLVNVRVSILRVNLWFYCLSADNA